MGTDDLNTDVIPAGSRWHEKDTGRTVIITGPGPNSPWWRYEDDPTRAQHHCCIEDFFLWGRFRRVT